MRVAVAWALGLACSTGAAAADKLAFAPPPDWVKPVAMPKDAAPPDDAALRVLLLDEQYDLQPGAPTRYAESVFRIQTPQGLAAGGATFAWNPETQTPVVHKLLIRRGDQIIDVLKSGQTFTVVRRESNLENAVIDGVLTATIQPEGVQVGDTIDFAVSITERDPAIGHHLEQAAAAWNGSTIVHAHLAARWPADVPMRLRAAGGATLPKPVKSTGYRSIELTQDDIRPMPQVRGAPARYQQGRLIEMTDFAGWGDLAAHFAPLFAKAATLPASGPLQDELARIRAASPDPKARAQAALALVQDRVRYVALLLNDGGLVPADAATTWARRFGDCKAKTVLLIALLHAMDIPAEPVLVSAGLGDGMDQRLPMVRLFNHVVVRATIAGRTYWLDGTRTGDTNIDDIATPDFRWGLPLVPGTTALVAMRPAPLDRPQIEVAIRIDARGGITLPAPVHVDRVIRGDDAITTNIAIANVPAANRDAALRAFWKQLYDFVDARTFANRFDPATRTLTMAVDGTTKMDWDQGFYEADHVWVGYKADFARDPGPDRDAPYAVGFPSYTRVTETIQLPPGAPFTVNAAESDVDETVAATRYRRRSTVKDGVFTVVQEDRTLAPEFPASEAPAAETRLRALIRQSVYLKRPVTYQNSPAENDAALAAQPDTAAGNQARAILLLAMGREKDAVAALDHALVQDPKFLPALGLRVFLRLRNNDLEGARIDTETARRIDPAGPVVLTGDAGIAQASGDYARASDLYGQLLAKTPNDAFALGGRARVRREVGDLAGALADSAAALAVNPRDYNLRQMRADIFYRQGDGAAAIREADALLAAMPDLPFALVLAGKAYAASGRKDESMRFFDRALAIKPEAFIYLNRAEARPPADQAGRLADLDAALVLDPKLSEAAMERATILAQYRDPVAAIAAYDRALVLTTGEKRAGVFVRRGIVRFRAGDRRGAQSDFTAARGAATSADWLNSICWSKAVSNVALETALSECEAAVARDPNPSNLDSRAFVLLRLGRYDESIASYDRAIAARPMFPESLFGRAVAERRKGNAAAAARDAEAARKADTKVEAQFAAYGVTL